jgi:hypothetical protein
VSGNRTIVFEQDKAEERDGLKESGTLEEFTAVYERGEQGRIVAT